MSKRYSVIFCGLFVCLSHAALAYEVKVISSVEQHIEWLQSNNWWGEENREQTLIAPRMVLSGITREWGNQANDLPVQTKKEIFYRYATPMALFANELTLAQRRQLIKIQNQLRYFDSVRTQDQQWLSRMSVEYKLPDIGPAWVLQASAYDLRSVVDELMLRIDAIPAGLVIGQAAYESGYGTSRFAVEGNALFGQWTFDGQGMKPKYQRTEQLGDHRIATFDWPFQSFRGYFNNLNTHPAYERFRVLRAGQRQQNQALSSLVLADGLTKYSERGQDYVDALKSTIRQNRLYLADNAAFAEGEVVFVFGQQDGDKAVLLEQELQQLAREGKLQELKQQMRL